PSYTPTLVLVLPTSSTSSTSEDSDLAGHDAVSPLAVLQHQRAVDVESDGDAGDAVHGHATADRIGEDEPAGANRRQPVALETRPPAVEGLEQRRQHHVAVHDPLRLAQHRRGARGEARGKLALTEVDADADGDHAGPTRGPRDTRGRHAALAQAAGDLPVADQDVGGPLQARAQRRRTRERIRAGQRADQRRPAPPSRRAPRPPARAPRAPSARAWPGRRRWPPPRA